MSKVVGINNPLIDPTPPEVHLTNAPLVCVLGQVRFPQILAVEDRKFVTPFQEAIRTKYPKLRQERTYQLTFDNQEKDAVRSQAEVIWQFTDANNHFLERMREVLTAVNEHIQPNLVERIGIRYVDRIEGIDVGNISNLVRSELINITASTFQEHILQSYNESLFQLPNTQGTLVARWGLIPSNATFDPNVLEPIDQPSWFLDLDMSISENQEFDVEKILEDAKRFSERIYTFFRWSVTEEFLRRFGGEQ